MTALDLPSPFHFANPDQAQPLTPAPVSNKGASSYVLVHAVSPVPLYLFLPYLHTLEMATSLRGSEDCPSSPSEFDPFAPVARFITSPDGNFFFFLEFYLLHHPHTTFHRNLSTSRPPSTIRTARRIGGCLMASPSPTTNEHVFLPGTH